MEKQATTTATYVCDLCNTDMPNSEAMQHLIEKHDYARADVLKFKQQMCSHIDGADFYSSVYDITDHKGDPVGSKTVMSRREADDPMRFA